MDIIDEDPLIREYYFEKLQSLQKILKQEYLSSVIFEPAYELPEHKIISRLYVELPGVSIHNKNDWPEVKAFLASNMLKLEEFFLDFRDFISN